PPDRRGARGDAGAGESGGGEGVQGGGEVAGGGGQPSLTSQFRIRVVRDCRESRHLAPLETPSFTHPPLAEFGEFGTLRDDFTHGGHRWPNWERSRSWSQRTWCTKAPRSGRSPGRWA